MAAPPGHPQGLLPEHSGSSTEGRGHGVHPGAPEAAGRSAATRSDGRRPLVGALLAVATVLLVCVPPGRAQLTEPVRAPAADLASAVLVACCAVPLLRCARRPLGPLAVTVFAAPAVAGAVATVTAYDPAAALPGFVRHLQLFVLVPAAMVLLLHTRRAARAVAASVVLLALVQGAIGVHQYLTGAGASYQGREIRAVGTFGPQDVMAMSTVVSFGLIVALAVGLAPSPAGHRLLRPVALGCATLLLVPLAVSFSRGAWLATAAAALVVLVLAGVRRALGALAVLLACAVVLVGGAGVGSASVEERLGSMARVASHPDRSVADRYELWRTAVAIWRADPATGAGPRGFAARRDTHASLALSSGSDTAGAGLRYRREPLLSPHNLYLLVLSEQGLVGLTAVLGSLTAVAVAGLRRLYQCHRAGRRTDCGLAAIGLLTWNCVNFLYADIGGPSTVLAAVALGTAAWWALSPAARPVAAGGAEPALGRPRPKQAPREGVL